MIKTGLKAVFLSLYLANSAFAFKVGVTAGPHAMIMEKVKELAKKQGLEIEIIEFNDFILPNIGLDEGSLDANSYQHAPFLEEQVKLKGYKIISLAKTVLMPLGIYSNTFRTIGALPDGAVIAIPNDPTNGGRALKLLEKLGLLVLKKGSVLPSVLDIEENSKKLKIREIEAPQLPRLLQDVAAAVINTDWVLVANLDPKSAIATESTDNLYANVIAVQIVKKNSEEVKKFIKVYHSTEIKEYIQKEFKGAILPTW